MRGSLRAGVVLAVLGVAPPLAAAPGGPDPLIEAARDRVAALEKREADPRSTNDDLVAAIGAVEDAYGDLGPFAPPGKQKEAEDAREQVRRAGEAALLRALASKDVAKGTRENLRHPVQVRAARALGRCDPRVASWYRHVILQEVVKDHDYDPFPALYEAAFDALLRMDRDRTFEWLIKECITQDNMPEPITRLLCALRAMRRTRGVPGRLRHAVVDRIIQLFQGPEFWWIDDYQEVAGFRSDKQGRKMMFGGPYWNTVRLEVEECIRFFAKDPRTGLPPFDYNDGSEMERIGRYLVWFANNQVYLAAPWVDPADPAFRVPRGRTDDPYVRPGVSAIERKYGVTWECWWKTDRPVPPRSAASGGGPTPVGETLRTKTLPPVLVKALVDPEEAVRAVAAVFLGRLAAPGAADKLKAVLATDESETVREAALLGMLHLGYPALRDDFRRRVEDAAENPRVRAYAVLALGYLGDAAFLKERLLAKGGPRPKAPERVLHDLQACALRALGAAKAPGDGAFLAGLLSGDALPTSIRGQAGTSLLRLVDHAALPGVLAALADRGVTDDRHAVQAGAAVALSGVAGPADLKDLGPVEALLREPEGRFGGVRNLVALSFARIGGPRIHEALAADYKRCRPDTKRYAERGWYLIAFGTEGGKEAVALLEDELEKFDHDRDRAACAVGLALAGDQAAIPAIRKRLEEEGREFAPYGMAALARLGDRGAVPAIRRILERRSGDGAFGDSDLREGALALAALLGEKAVPDLLALWGRCADPGDFDAVARAFRDAAGDAAVEPLLAIRGDAARPPEERAFALAALCRMAEPAPSPIDREFATDFDPYAEGTTLTLLHRSPDLPFLLGDER